MRCAQLGKCFAAVMRNPQRIHFWRVRGVRILGVHINRHVIKGALAQLHLLVDSLPCGAGVVGAKNAAVFCLNDGIDNVRFACRDGHADASQNSLRQTGIARDIGPVGASVSGLVDAAARATA